MLLKGNKKYARKYVCVCVCVQNLAWNTSVQRKQTLAQSSTQISKMTYLFCDQPQGDEHLLTVSSSYAKLQNGILKVYF